MLTNFSSVRTRHPPRALLRAALCAALVGAALAGATTPGGNASAQTLENEGPTGAEIATARGRAIEAAQELSDRAGRAYLRGALEESDALLEQALRVYALAGEQRGAVLTLRNLGQFALARHDWPRVERLYLLALSLYSEERGNGLGLGHIYFTLGVAAEARGGIEEARALYENSLREFTRAGSRDNMADLHARLALLARTRGDAAAAEKSYRRALDLFENLGHGENIALLHYALGELDEERAGPRPRAEETRAFLASAETHYRNALEAFSALDDPAGMALSYAGLSRISEGGEACRLRSLAEVTALQTPSLRLNLPARADAACAGTAAPSEP